MIGAMTFKAFIPLRDGADKFVEGQTVRLALSDKYKKTLFLGNELFWLGHFSAFGAPIELVVAD